MKVTFEINEKYEEPHVNIYANAMTETIKDIIRICTISDNPEILFGIKDEQLVPIQKDKVIRFFSQDKKTYCELINEELVVKEALYKLEERFTEMIRISNSEIINPDFIKDLELSITGTIKVNFKNGQYSYTSRRYMKEFKRRLGI